MEHKQREIVPKSIHWKNEAQRLEDINTDASALAWNNYYMAETLELFEKYPDMITALRTMEAVLEALEEEVAKRKE